MLTSVTSGGFGFIFWILAAKLYPKEDVGVATALISAMSLIVLLSRFGFVFFVEFISAKIQGIVHDKNVIHQ